MTDTKLIAAMLRDYAHAVRYCAVLSDHTPEEIEAQAAALEAQTTQPEISAGELEALEHCEDNARVGLHRFFPESVATICAALRRNAQPVAQVVDASNAIEAIREAVQQLVDGGIDKGQAIIYITDSLKSYDFRKAANE